MRSIKKCQNLICYFDEKKKKKKLKIRLVICYSYLSLLYFIFNIVLFLSYDNNKMLIKIWHPTTNNIPFSTSLRKQIYLDTWTTQPFQHLWRPAFSLRDVPSNICEHDQSFQKEIEYYQWWWDPKVFQYVKASCENRASESTLAILTIQVFFASSNTSGRTCLLLYIYLIESPQISCLKLSWIIHTSLCRRHICSFTAEKIFNSELKLENIYTIDIQHEVYLSRKL